MNAATTAGRLDVATRQAWQVAELLATWLSLGSR